MSWFKKIFGGGESASAASAGPAQEYKGFSIMPTPIKEGGQWRLAGTISKEIGGATKEHKFIRADLFSSKDEAAQFTVSKAQLIIDQSGDSIFS
jgi:hypothetical protein